MNMLVKSVEVQYRGQGIKRGVWQPPIRAFMDDLTVTTTSFPSCWWILNVLEDVIFWAHMTFKPTKSRSLVLKKGTPKIPSLTEAPLKSLGKVFNCSLRDVVFTQATNQDMEAWLAVVDEYGLPGKFKAWIYQHRKLPWIIWPLLVYEVPISTVGGFERRISRFLHRWLGLPRSL